MRYFTLVFLLFWVMTGVALENENIEYRYVEYIIDKDFINKHDSLAIIEPLRYNVHTWGGFDRYEKDLSSYTKNQRLVFACHEYMDQVYNGGHDQFYWNSSGMLWRDAIDCFDAIGMPKIAELIRKSAIRQGGSPSKDREERTALLEKLEPNFSDLDDEFYNISKRDIKSALKAFIVKNMDDFVCKGVMVKASYDQKRYD